uniref:Regulator of nonsense transcripts 2 n=2 Tax=Timema bartmani TaxID=61472 RepID=A0A7R9HYL9_9NEOP|nr:unnamed protein product [Timema bartmani]
MDPVVSSERTVPERRAKSWRREHEERCNRRLTQKKPSHTPGDATVGDGTNTGGCSSVDEFMCKDEHSSNKNDVKPSNSENSMKGVQPEETSARSKAHKLLPQENIPCVCNGKMTISSGSLKCTLCSDSITDLEEKVKDLGSKKMSSNSDLTDKVDTLIDLIAGIANGPIDQNSLILSDDIPSTYDRGKEAKVKPNNGLKTLAELAQDSIFGVTCYKSNITPPDIDGYVVDIHAEEVSQDDKMETPVLDTNKDSYFPENHPENLVLNQNKISFTDSEDGISDSSLPGTTECNHSIVESGINTGILIVESQIYDSFKKQKSGFVNTLLVDENKTSESHSVHTEDIRADLLSDYSYVKPTETKSSANAPNELINNLSCNSNTVSDNVTLAKEFEESLLSKTEEKLTMNTDAIDIITSQTHHERNRKDSGDCHSSDVKNSSTINAKDISMKIDFMSGDGEVLESSKLQINSEQEKPLSVSTESDIATNHTSLPENSTNELTQEELGALADSEDRKYLLRYIVEAEERLASTAKLREINQTVAASRPDESYFTKLDSSLKKNTAFVRKLKMFTASQLDSLLKDMSTLNLTKYISEAAAALVEAKLKMNDISYVIKLCNALHRDYADFSTHLLDNWQKVLSIKKDDKSFIQSKLRVDLRFYAEVINSGILTHKEGLPLLGSVLTVLINMDKEEHNNINIILTFCRYCGEDYAGLVSRKIRQLAERYLMTVPRSTLLSKEKQRNVRTLLKDYYTSLCKHLLKEHRELQAFERQNKKILQTKGELSGERRERGTALQLSLQRLLTGTQGFSEVLDEDFPLLPQDDAVNIETLDSKVGNSESEDGLLSSNMWEDDETQNFYEYLPNMKDFLPSLTVQTNDLEAQVSEEALEADHLEELADDCLIIKEEEEEPLPPDPEEVEEPESQASSSNKILLESFFTSLPQCVNREMIDNAAVDFVMTLNTKYNRKKLVKMLFSVPRTRLDLLPFYARLVAILHPVMPDIATELGQFLKQDFKFHIRKKDQINIESKIKVVRFVGELVKFRMYSKIEALYCLKLLLHDFTHHHIEMCCNLLESCGRFLFRHPDSHQRTKAYLEQMMRKKSVTALDSRYVTMIENAYYHVNPPELAPYVKKERPPMHEFIRKILYQDLTKPNTDKVLRLMRKLEWDNEELSSYAVKCLTFAFNVKYYNIRCLANLVAGLVTYQECVGTQVVDGVMEDIRLGMEINQAKHNQRRVAMVKYLGELYNYRMVESGDVFKVLYSLITFGVSMSHDVPSDLDPPEHLFRIRLVCILLETCGQYFSTGISKKKLDYFLLFFQNYYWFKFSDPYWVTENTFPVGMTHMFRDTLLNLRPNLLLYANFEDAQKGIEDLKNEFAKTVLKQFQSVLNSPSEHEEPSAGGVELDTIMETAAEQEEQLDGDESKADEESEPVGAIENKEKDESMSLQSRDSGCDIGKDDEDVKDEEEYKNDNGTLNFEEEEEDERDIDDNEDCDTVSEFDDASPFTSQSQSDEVNMLGALPPGPSRVECPEDDEFLNAFEQMVSSNIQDRMRETVKPQQLDISVPLHIKNSAKKTYEQLQEPKPEQKSMINFVLMVRKGHKQQYKSLAVPVTSELALNLRDREEAERAEKQRVKRLTLDINERLEEEDYQEMLAQGQRPVVMNLNRERRHKYQHPKGAPDADLIFGSKRAR